MTAAGYHFRPAAAQQMKGGVHVGRPRAFRTPKALLEAWEKYKSVCDDQSVLTHEFSAKNSEFVSKKLSRAITYTIEGFCVFLGLARSAFYEHYSNTGDFADVVTRIREECEVDAREKFELGILPTQLSGLWMSKYGYSTKADTNITGAVPIVIHDDL
jgi:hypothetical protein